MADTIYIAGTFQLSWDGKEWCVVKQLGEAWDYEGRPVFIIGNIPTYAEDEEEDDEG